MAAWPIANPPSFAGTDLASSTLKPEWASVSRIMLVSNVFWQTPPVSATIDDVFLIELDKAFAKPSARPT